MKNTQILDIKNHFLKMASIEKALPPAIFALIRNAVFSREPFYHSAVNE